MRIEMYGLKYVKERHDKNLEEILRKYEAENKCIAEVKIWYKPITEKEVIKKGEETQALQSSLELNVAGTTGYQELPAKRPLDTDAPSSEKTI